MEKENTTKVEVSPYVYTLDRQTRRMSIYVAFAKTTINLSAVSLAQASATIVNMQAAGRWKSSQMPAHYAKPNLPNAVLSQGSKTENDKQDAHSIK